MNTRFDLGDKEWGLIETLLPGGLRGARRVDNRKILDGIFSKPAACTIDFLSHTICVPSSL